MPEKQKSVLMLDTRGTEITLRRSVNTSLSYEIRVKGDLQGGDNILDVLTEIDHQLKTRLEN